MSLNAANPNQLRFQFTVNHIHMAESEVTRPTLLLRVRDAADGQAWSQFVRIYSPLVYRYDRRRGLQDADAADVTQDVLQTVAGAIGRFEYHPGKGLFRSWLMSVARTRLCDFLARRGRQARGSGDTAVEKVIEAQPSEDGEEDRWEQDYQRCVFDWAVEQIRGDFQDSTWQAFWQTNVEGKETKKVAQSLGMTVGAVYIARSRVLARLKKEIGQVED